MLKKLMIICICALMSFVVQAATAWVNGVEWTYQVSNGKAEIYNATFSAAIPTSTQGAITIPSTLDGYTVTSIGFSAFYHCSGLTSVTIPDSVTSIGSYAFYECSGLTSMTNPFASASPLHP